MPVIRTELEDEDIREAVLKLGYGLHLERSSAIRLSLPDTDAPTRSSGRHPRKLLAPISKAKYDRIRKYAENVKQAAIQVVALSKGELTDPNLPQEHGGGAGIDVDTMKTLVANEVANAIEDMKAPLKKELAEVKEVAAEKDAEIKGLRKQAADLLKALEAKNKKKGKKGKGGYAKPAEEAAAPVAEAAPAT